MPRSTTPDTRTVASDAPAISDPVGEFEAAMQELETVVQSLERGELKLEQSLQLFERGVVLARQCRQSLQSAELKVHDLLAASGDAGAS